jgi:hypothetical protein
LWEKIRGGRRIRRREDFTAEVAEGTERVGMGGEHREEECTTEDTEKRKARVKRKIGKFAALERKSPP